MFQIMPRGPRHTANRYWGQQKSWLETIPIVMQTTFKTYFSVQHEYREHKLTIYNLCPVHILSHIKEKTMSLLLQISSKHLQSILSALCTQFPVRKSLKATESPFSNLCPNFHIDTHRGRRRGEEKKKKIGKGCLAI